MSLPFVPLYVACEFYTLRGACFTFLKQTCHDHSCVLLLPATIDTAAGGAAGGGGGSSTTVPLLLLLFLIYMTVVSVVVSSLSPFVTYNITL